MFAWLMKAVAMIDASKPKSAGDELKIKVDLSKPRLYDPVSELAIHLRRSLLILFFLLRRNLCLWAANDS